VVRGRRGRYRPPASRCSNVDLPLPLHIDTHSLRSSDKRHTQLWLAARDNVVPRRAVSEPQRRRFLVCVAPAHSCIKTTRWEPPGRSSIACLAALSRSCSAAVHHATRELVRVSIDIRFPRRNRFIPSASRQDDRGRIVCSQSKTRSNRHGSEPRSGRKAQRDRNVSLGEILREGHHRPLAEGHRNPRFHMRS